MQRDFSYLKHEYGTAGAREKFESICTDILINIFKNNVHNVEPNPGDDGIDVFVGHFNSEISVYQCKYFYEGIGESQKSQIRKSFNKVVNSGYNLKEWILCVPCVLNPESHSWWDGWRENNEINLGISINLLDGNQLIDIMKKQRIYDRYFKTITLDSELFNSISSNNIIEEINQDFKDVMFCLDNYSLYNMPYFVIGQIDYIVAKYKEDIHFRDTNIVLGLNEIASYISVDVSTVGKEYLLNQFKRLVREIIEEYRGLKFSSQ